MSFDRHSYYMRDLNAASPQHVLQSTRRSLKRHINDVVERLKEFQQESATTSSAIAEGFEVLSNCEAGLAELEGWMTQHGIPLEPVPVHHPSEGGE